jgi:PAS domain S-box-containing protein
MENSRILIVEDEVIIAMEIKNSIKNLGYKVTSVVNTGDKAIQKAKDEEPDLILMDIRLKGDMDGIEAASQIQASLNTPIIFLTAFAEEAKLERAKLILPFGYLLKPVQDRELKVTIEMALYVSKVDVKRKQAEMKLVASEKRFKQVTEQSPSVYELYNLDGLQIDVNKAYEDLWQFSEGRERTVGLFNVLKSQEVVDTGLIEYVNKAYSGEVAVVPPYQFNPTGETEAKGVGRLRWLSTKIYPLKDNNDKVTNIVITHEDITDKKFAEDSLIKNEQKQSSMISNISDVIGILDAKGVTMYKSPNIKKYFGWDTEDLIGKSAFETVHPDDMHKARKVFMELMQTKGSTATLEFNYKCKDGSYLPIELKAVNKLDNPNIKGILINYRDISERKHAEEDLKKAHDELEQKVGERTAALQQEIDERKQIEHDLIKTKREAEFANNAKTDFLSNMSHEIRTPMHQILSYSKFGVNKIEKVDKERLFHYFSQIDMIGHNLLALLNNLLDLSKLESGKLDYVMGRIELYQVISEVSQEFDSLIIEKGLSFEIKKSNIPTETMCDKQKISQVIRNLLSNAVKFTQAGGNISISVKQGKLRSERRKIETGSIPSLLVSVTDQGIGIPEDELANVFDKFVQSSRTKTGSGGTGLGLAICREIIHAHNGKIWAENNLDVGATFSFMLPYE